MDIRQVKQVYIYDVEFEPTTNRIKPYSRKDTYHVKSDWHISLPEPVAIPQKDL